MPNLLSVGFLLFPLLGGYIFIRYFVLTRFHFRHSDGQGLYFAAASVGLLLFSVCQVVIVEWRDTVFGLWMHGVIKRYADFPHSGAAIGSLIMAVVAGSVLNAFERYQPRRVIHRIAKSSGDDLLVLLLRAQDEKEVVLVTLSNRKCYVGYVLDTSDLRPDSDYVKMLPIHSGFRTSLELHLELVMTYDETILLLARYWAGEVEAEAGSGLLNLQIVLRRDDISSASFFNPDVYQRHHRLRHPQVVT